MLENGLDPIHIEFNLSVFVVSPLLYLRFGPYGIPITMFPKREYKDKPESMQLKTEAFQSETDKGVTQGPGDAPLRTLRMLRMPLWRTLLRLLQRPSPVPTLKLTHGPQNHLLCFRRGPLIHLHCSSGTPTTSRYLSLYHAKSSGPSVGCIERSPLL